MLIKYWKFFFLIIFLASSTFSQNQMKNSVFGNGAVKVSNAGNGMIGTIGQPVIGMASNSSTVGYFGYWYSLRIYVGIEDADNLLPKKFELFQNYPNPFNPVTKIKYAIPRSAHVRLEIYNVLGQRISTLVNEDKTPGFYTIDFDASSLASGFYIYRFMANDFHAVKKMIVTK
jgi:hypothetical protein